MLWVYETSSIVASSPIIRADGTVYLITFDGSIIAITSYGKLKWKVFMGGL